MKCSDSSMDELILAFHRTLDILRSKEGCPWDRSQSIADMASYLIDEAYELQSSILGDDREGISEEISDTFYVLIYIHYLFLQEGGISLGKLISSAHDKIRRRHPHVFADASADTVSESISEWEKAKSSEKKRSSLLDSVPGNLPPMRRAISVSRKAVNTGFAWPDQEGVLKQIEEEIEELREGTEKGDRENIKEEIGDLLFTMINLALHNGIDPEGALSGTVEKFIARFRCMERMAELDGTNLQELTVDEMEILWEKSKKNSA